MNVTPRKSNANQQTQISFTASPNISAHTAISMLNKFPITFAAFVQNCFSAKILTHAAKISKFAICERHYVNS